VVGDDLPNRVICLGELGGRVDERAAAEARGGDVRSRGGDDRADGGAGVRRGGDDLLGLRAHAVVAAGDVLEDEVVLGAVVLVEGRLRDARRGDDAVDSDVADAVFVEERRRRLEDAALRGSALRGRRFLDDHHSASPLRG
jgi:hypothetical protein